MREVDPLTGLREKIAEAVRVEMARARVSQRVLAERTGLSQSAISRRMTGETAFDLDDLEKMAAALGIPTSTLMSVERSASAA